MIAYSGRRMTARVALLCLVLAGSAHAEPSGVCETIGWGTKPIDGVVRCTPKGEAVAFAPSEVLQRAKSLAKIGDAPGGGGGGGVGGVGGAGKVVPIFSRSPEGRWSTRIDLMSGTSLYGTFLSNDFGTKASASRLPVRTTHPWVLGVRSDGSAFGLLIDGPSSPGPEGYEISMSPVDPKDLAPSKAVGSIQFVGGTAAFAVYVIDQESPDLVLRRLRELAGVPALPPLWAFGPQCVVNRSGVNALTELASTLRDRELPFDGAWIASEPVLAGGAGASESDTQPLVVPKSVSAALEKAGARAALLSSLLIKPTDAIPISSQTGVKPDLTSRSFLMSSVPRFGPTASGTLFQVEAISEGSLAAGLKSGLSAGLSGVPAFGVSSESLPEAGGATLSRWIGVSTLMPFAFFPAGTATGDKGLLSFSSEQELGCALALRRRARLVPYFYTLFQESIASGLPIVRPAFFADTKDQSLRSETGSFLVGERLLVVTRPSDGHQPAMPSGIWNEVFLVEEGLHPDLPRLYVRGGTILPLGPARPFVGESNLSPLTLMVSLDANGNAIGTVYEDEGDGFGHLSGDYRLTTFVARTEGSRVKIEAISRDGKGRRFQRDMRVMIVKDDGFFAGVAVDGQSLMLDLRRQPFVRFITTPPAAKKREATPSK